MENRKFFTLAALLFVILAIALFAIPTNAQELRLTKGLFCDSAEQVATLIDLREAKGKSPDEAFEAVNAGGKPNCILVTAIAIRGDVVKTMFVKGNRYDIYEFVLIAVEGVGNIKPMKQYAALMKKGQDA